MGHINTQHTQSQMVCVVRNLLVAGRIFINHNHAISSAIQIYVEGICVYMHTKHVILAACGTLVGS